MDMKVENFSELLHLMNENLTEEPGPMPTLKEILYLKKAREALRAPNRFKEGDIVCWRERMRNKRFPEYDRPAIVLEVLDVPIINEEDSPNSFYFHEKLDVKIGFFDDDGDFGSCLFDSGRFEKYPDN